MQNTLSSCGLGFYVSSCRSRACVLSLSICQVWICKHVLDIVRFSFYVLCHFYIIVFWFVQVEILKAVHPDYASRVQNFLDKFNEEAEKVGHTPVLYFVTVSLYFRVLWFICANDRRRTVISSFFVPFCPFQNASVRVYTRPGASAMAASSKMWWIKTLHQWQPCVNKSKCTYSQLLLKISTWRLIFQLYWTEQT